MMKLLIRVIHLKSIRVEVPLFWEKDSTHFCKKIAKYKYPKIETKSFESFRKLLLSLSIASYTKNLFFLRFRIWNFFADLSLFSLYVMFVSWSSNYFYFLSSLLPTCYWIFVTSYLVIILFTSTFTTFHCLSKSDNAWKIVCILFPNCQSYFNFLHPLWVFLNSQRIRIDTQICSTQPKQPKFSIYNTEKKLKQRKQLILNNSKNILT